MLAIIPARGGSKGVPGKNIKQLCGKPLIAYTIEAALNSTKIDHVIVSTDSREIADVAVKFGAEVPFLRPDELATDHAKAIDNYIYTIERLNSIKSNRIEKFIVLQPTSPLRKSKNIDESIDIFNEKNADSVISVKKAEHPPEWYKVINKDGVLVNYLPGKESLNRQEYTDLFLPNGAIFIFKFDILKTKGTYYTDMSFPYQMDDISSIDIDTLLDFSLAESILKQRKYGINNEK